MTAHVKRKNGCKELFYATILAYGKLQNVRYNVDHDPNSYYSKESEEQGQI